MSLGPGSPGLRNISCSLCTLLCPQQGLSPTHCVGTSPSDSALSPQRQKAHPNDGSQKTLSPAWFSKAKGFCQPPSFWFSVNSLFLKEGAEVDRGLPLTALKPADL